jgi:hypothetical protein
MTISKVVHIRLKDWALVGCLDYVTDKTSVSDAVRRTLETFILFLQKQGKIPTHSQDSLASLLERNNLIEPESSDNNDLEALDSLLYQTREDRSQQKGGESFESIAARVEQQIRAASVPDVRQSVELGEPDSDDLTGEQTLNLFEQERIPFNILKRDAPKDRFIEQGTSYLLHPDKMTDEQRVFIAALEIVYTNMPKDLWGTEKALLQINSLIAIHKE